MFFNGPDNPIKLMPVGVSGPHLIHGSLSPVYTRNNVEATFDFVAFDNFPSTSLLVWTAFRSTRVTHPRTGSRSVQPFLQGTSMWPTHRQTDRQTTPRATSLAIGRIYAKHTMRPDNECNTQTEEPLQRTEFRFKIACLRNDCAGLRGAGGFSKLEGPV